MSVTYKLGTLTHSKTASPETGIRGYLLLLTVTVLSGLSILPIFCCSGKIFSFDEAFDSLFDDYWTGKKTCLQLFCHLSMPHSHGSIALLRDWKCSQRQEQRYTPTSGHRLNL